MTIKSIIIATVVVIISSTVQAGSTFSVPVQIDLTNRAASGNMTTARFSNNENELIGCGIRRWVDFNGQPVAMAYCQARTADSNGDYIYCDTENPHLVGAIDAINNFSYVSFRWNEDEECTYIGNSAQSWYLPEF